MPQQPLQKLVYIYANKGITKDLLSKGMNFFDGLNSIINHRVPAVPFAKTQSPSRPLRSGVLCRLWGFSRFAGDLFWRKRRPQGIHARSLCLAVLPCHPYWRLISVWNAEARLCQELRLRCRPCAQPITTPRLPCEPLTGETATRNQPFIKHRK